MGLSFSALEYFFPISGKVGSSKIQFLNETVEFYSGASFNFQSVGSANINSKAI